MLFVAIPEIAGTFSAGKPAYSDFYEVLRLRHVPFPTGCRATDQLYFVRVCGDSLLDEGVRSGDWIVFKVANEARPGRLCVVSTPGGEIIKFVWPQSDGTVILRSANPDFPDQIWEQTDVQIRGIVVQSGRDW